MAESGQEDRSPITLAERFDRYRVAAQQVVERGIEHPSYELKRTITISKQNLADRLDFVKLVQGIANAHIAEERFVVIGADQKERRFYNVANVDEFDPARLSQIVAKYLDPPPRLDGNAGYSCFVSFSFLGGRFSLAGGGTVSAKARRCFCNCWSHSATRRW